MVSNVARIEDLAINQFFEVHRLHDEIVAGNERYNKMTYRELQIKGNSLACITALKEMGRSFIKIKNIKMYFT